jgi:hypothetical protein
MRSLAATAKPNPGRAEMSSRPTLKNKQTPANLGAENADGSGLNDFLIIYCRPFRASSMPAVFRSKLPLVRQSCGWRGWLFVLPERFVAAIKAWTGVEAKPKSWEADLFTRKTCSMRRLLPMLTTMSYQRRHYEYGWKIICELPGVDPVKVRPSFEVRDTQQSATEHEGSGES